MFFFYTGNLKYVKIDVSHIFKVLILFILKGRKKKYELFSILKSVKCISFKHIRKSILCFFYQTLSEIVLWWKITIIVLYLQFPLNNMFTNFPNSFIIFQTKRVKESCLFLIIFKLYKKKIQIKYTLFVY